MADDVDRASEIEQARILNSLHVISREMSERNDELLCIDCDEEIEDERRRILPSARRCFVCQKLHEKQTRVKRY